MCITFISIACLIYESGNKKSVKSNTIYNMPINGFILRTQPKFSLHKSAYSSWIVWDIPSVNYLYKFNLCEFEDKLDKFCFTVNLSIKCNF